MLLYLANTTGDRLVYRMKRLIILSASVGAGAVLMAALIFAGMLWYRSRPVKPEPWNIAALKCVDKSAFVRVDKVDRHMSLVYTVENTSAQDYSVTQCPSCLLLAARV